MGNIRQVYPQMENFTLPDVKEKGQCFYKRELGEAIRICNDLPNGIDDYNWLLAIEKSCDRCEPMGFEIRCNASDVVLYSGRVKLNQSNFDEVQKTIELKIESDDPYTCLFDNWEREFNILESTNKVTVNPRIGNIVCQTCSEIQQIPVVDVFTLDFNPLTSNNCIAGPAWTITRNENQNLGAPPPGNLANIQVNTTWCREEVTGGPQPPGDGWIADGANWVRPLNAVFNSALSDTSILDDDQTLWIYSVPGLDENNNPITYDNGVRLSDVLELILNDSCGLTIISDFFGINADNTSPDNMAYQCALSQLQNLIVYQITDITNANAINNATRAILDLKTAIECLKELLNICFEIEGDTLRIEHVSRDAKNEGIDLTTRPNAEFYLRGTEKWSYDTDNLPRFEKWIFPTRQSRNFHGCEIEYSVDCSNGETEEHKVDCFYTDLAHVTANADQIDTDAFFLMAAVEFNGNLYTDYRTNPKYNETDANGALSLPNIHQCYWVDDRFQSAGLMNDVETAFNARKYRKQIELIIPMCCDEYSAWNPKDLIKSTLGWGEVGQPIFDANSRCLKVELLHDDFCQPEPPFMNSCIYVNDFPPGGFFQITQITVDGTNYLSSTQTINGNNVIMIGSIPYATDFVDLINSLNIPGFSASYPAEQDFIDNCADLNPDTSVIADYKLRANEIMVINNPNNLNWSISIPVAGVMINQDGYINVGLVFDIPFMEIIPPCGCR